MISVGIRESGPLPFSARFLFNIIMQPIEEMIVYTFNEMIDNFGAFSALSRQVLGQWGVDHFRQPFSIFQCQK